MNRIWYWTWSQHPKRIIGSQEVPFIYEDRISGEKQVVVRCLMKMYEYGHKKNAQNLGQRRSRAY